MAQNLISILIQARDNASNELLQVSRSVDRLGSSSQAATGPAGGMSGALDGMAGRVGALAAAFVGYQVIQKLEDFGAVAVSSAAELQQTNMSFDTLIGNTQQASRLFGELVQYANVTPFQAKDVTDAAKQLLAFGQTAEDVTTTVKQLGDVVAAGGGDLKAMSLVSGQVFAQGKMRAQDMYQVINDGGAGLIKIMADNVGGMQNLTAEFDKGGIPAQQYFDAIKTATAQGGFAFEGADKQAQTFNGRLSTLKDAAANFGREMIGVHIDPQLGLQIAPGGLFDRMSGSLKTISDRLQDIGPAAGVQFAKFVTAAQEGAGILESRLGPAFSELWDTVEKRLWPAFQRLSPAALEWLKVLATVGVAAIIIVINSINVLAAILGWLMQVIANVGQWFVDRWHDIASIWGQASGFFQDIGNSIGQAFASVTHAITAPFQAAYDFIKTLPQKMVDSFAGIGGSIRSTLGNIDIPGPLGKVKDVIPGFALGTTYAPGGVAMVGEYGPEAVVLPQGAAVIPANRTRQLAQGGMGGGVTLNQTNHIYNQVDITAALREQGWRLAHA